MTTDPLIDAARENDRLANRERLYWAAFEGLTREFHHALAKGPYTLVATPHESPDGLAVIELVRDVIDHQGDVLARLLQVAQWSAANGSIQAQGLIEHLARAYASNYTRVMDDAGDFA